jgi:hypothetical protein
MGYKCRVADRDGVPREGLSFAPEGRGELASRSRKLI